MDAGSSGSVPTKLYVRTICFHSNRTSLCFFSGSSFNDTSGINVPPKIPARSKTPLRSVKKGTQEVNPDDPAGGGVSARKQKGGAAENVTAPPPPPPPEAAMEAAQSASPASGAVKEANKSDAVSTENSMSAGKTVPPSPKVYIRKVKGKGRKDPKT